MTSTFTDGDVADSNWSSNDNWNPADSPDNNASFVYDVILPSSLTNDVILDTSLDINSLTVAAGATLNFNNGRTLIFVDDLSTNNGLIQLNGASGATRILFDHSDGDPVTLGGSGIVRLTGGSQNFSGGGGQLLINGPSHSIEGFNPTSSLGSNVLNFQNDGTVSANVSGEILILSPADTFVNNGTVQAINGGLLTFFPATYSGSGLYQIADNSEFTIDTGSSGLWQNITFTADDQDADAANNIIRAIDAMRLDNVTFEQGLTVTNDNSARFEFVGDITNNTLIQLNGASANNRIRVAHPNVDPVTLGGVGIVRLTGGSQNFNGATSGQLLINGPDHTIEGSNPGTSLGSSLGANILNLRNEGTISANVSGETLKIDPVDTFVNTGTVQAFSGGTLTFFPGIYSGEGLYQVSDNSEFISATGSSGLWQNLTFSADDQDADAANNTISTVDAMRLDNVTFEEGLTVTNDTSQRFELVGDVTNNALIDLNGASSSSRLRVANPSVQAVTIGGTGTLRLNGGAQNFDATNSNQLLINGPNHTIEGFSGSGSIGSNLLSIVNEGTISSSALVINPSNTFTNSGTLQSSSGILSLLGGTYQNTGLIEIAASASISLDGAASFTQTDGELRFDGNSTFIAGNTPFINGGKITGTGTIQPGENQNLSIANAILAPGLPDGTPGKLTFSPVGAPIIGSSGSNPVIISGGRVAVGNTRIEIDLISQSSHDSIDFIGLGSYYAEGSGLELSLRLHGPSSGFNGDPIIILGRTGSATIGAGGGTGPTTVGGLTFSNFVRGDRLTTSDGLASFIVGPVSIDNTIPSTVTLTDPLFAPEWDAEPYAFTIATNSPAGTPVGTVSATDPESDPVTYSIGPGPFAIGSSSGAITVADASAVTTDISYNIAVTATDGALSNTTIVTVTVGAPIATNASCVYDLLTQAGGAFPGETDPAIVGFDADPDKDRLSNVFELWLGTDPATSDSPQNLRVIEVGTAPNSMAALEATVDPAVDNLLEVHGALSFDFTPPFRIGTRNVVTEDSTSRTLQFVDPQTLIDAKAFGRLLAEPAATKSP
ncbi:MAG: hypothetical protein AAGJ79_01200 [Verrucomicrobiota bacterium]